MQFSHPLEQISFNKNGQAQVIEASAGTGKTWTIERLFIKALLEAGEPNDSSLPLTIDKLLVVTFTNDATNELKQRIQEQIALAINLIIYLHNQELKKLSSESGTANQGAAKSSYQSDIFINYLLKRQQLGDIRKDVTLLSRALQNFDSAAIYTIHGFCKRILNDYPFECVSPCDFELVASRSNLIEECVNDFMRSEVMNNPLFAADLAQLMSNLNDLFTGDFSLSLEERIAAKVPKDLFLLQDGKYQVKYQLKASANLLNLCSAELSVEQQRLAKAEYLATLLAYIASRYPARAIQSNTLSYDELIGKLADALVTNSELANKIFSLFPIAFIDEFQDTDALQWQIFSNIYLLNTIPRGNVVVVGDPKQAIYRFRGADVDTYLAACGQLGTQLILLQNHRSHANIMNFVNQLFSLENQGYPLEDSFLGNNIGYAASEARGKPKLVLPTAAELNKIADGKNINSRFYDGEVHLVAINGVTKEERTKKLLASMALEILTLLHADPDLKGKIAILVTKNREASEVVSFLRKYGIKATELKLGNIFASASARDLLRILTAISELSNRRNMLIALSSQIFNLDLSRLKAAADKSNPLLERWQRNFYQYKEIWEVRGIISFLYALINDIIASHAEMDAQPLNNYLTNRELANLWQLAELLNKQAAKCQNQIELLFWFRQKIEQAELSLSEDIDGNNEELIRLDNDDEQIIITTQHKSKGLEYDILFCPYFKSSIVLDGQYDFNYRRPFFANYQDGGVNKAELVEDSPLGQKIVNNDNKEAHRLNYVAITRAKSRLYIYLKQPTITRATGKYNSLQRPDKITELFGYKADDIAYNGHQLFNYAQFFSDDPSLALKQVALLPGVTVYNRNELSTADLDALKLERTEESINNAKVNFQPVNEKFSAAICYFRQSYSGLTRSDKSDDYPIREDYAHGEVVALQDLSYRYSILDDAELKGATFGILFHELCENYPFSQAQLLKILNQANIDTANNDYASQLTAMLDEAFCYSLTEEISLTTLKHSLHELEFNLIIQQSRSLNQELARLLANYFGCEHPFSQACRLLGKIEAGFLVGFIDLFFEHDGKYWVLDYKTNRLDAYTPAVNLHLLAPSRMEENNQLVDSMAEHHYYLQYLLYMVAIKRYLEQRLDLSDASHLLGGVIYYYVRGIYTQDLVPYQGVYLDSHCQELVSAIDDLLKGASVPLDRYRV